MRRRVVITIPTVNRLYEESIDQNRNLYLFREWPVLFGILYPLLKIYALEFKLVMNGLHFNNYFCKNGFQRKRRVVVIGFLDSVLFGGLIECLPFVERYLEKNPNGNSLQSYNRFAKAAFYSQDNISELKRSHSMSISHAPVYKCQSRSYLRSVISSIRIVRLKSLASLEEQKFLNVPWFIVSFPFFLFWLTIFIS